MPRLSDDRRRQIRQEEEELARAEAEYREQVKHELHSSAPTPPIPRPRMDASPAQVAGPAAQPVGKSPVPVSNSVSTLSPRQVAATAVVFMVAGLALGAYSLWTYRGSGSSVYLGHRDSKSFYSTEATVEANLPTDALPDGTKLDGPRRDVEERDTYLPPGMSGSGDSVPVEPSLPTGDMPPPPITHDPGSEPGPTVIGPGEGDGTVIRPGTIGGK